ncbi:hypothetical protein B0H14DRAFT_2613135 [Mycena olivaceomarginata]|nr:hypothetical protein B0H14DRAFT_2613135 [Mycena olivaceomarginata]
MNEWSGRKSSNPPEGQKCQKCQRSGNRIQKREPETEQWDGERKARGRGRGVRADVLCRGHSIWCKPIQQWSGKYGRTGTRDCLTGQMLMGKVQIQGSAEDVDGHGRLDGLCRAVKWTEVRREQWKRGVP